jgi:hypothetical protein
MEILANNIKEALKLNRLGKYTYANTSVSKVYHVPLISLKEFKIYMLKFSYNIH